MWYLGLWHLGLPDLNCPHLPLQYFLPFMNNPYDLWAEACRHEVCACPWRERQLWQKTLLSWLFCSAGRQQVNNSSIKVCTLDPDMYGCMGWKSGLWGVQGCILLCQIWPMWVLESWYVCISRLFFSRKCRGSKLFLDSSQMKTTMYIIFRKDHIKPYSSWRKICVPEFDQRLQQINNITKMMKIKTYMNMRIWMIECMGSNRIE